MRHPEKSGLPAGESVKEPNLGVPATGHGWDPAKNFSDSAFSL
ncbi:hypothetical protein AWB74_08776 [Caballeronia arvi]|uniref:Uncharacterized protein n=1 Tax=Caballeronia arvi TaxID=1777135 RepID=A0A158L684_9BURK|nr:hypothetical protein AWB74_08776 [Caballeronia arvi]